MPANESERVAAAILVGKRLFDLRHVASDALPAWAARLVVRVLLDRTRMRSVWKAGAMALEAHHAGWFG